MTPEIYCSFQEYAAILYILKQFLLWQEFSMRDQINNPKHRTVLCLMHYKGYILLLPMGKSKTIKINRLLCLLSVQYSPWNFNIDFHPWKSSLPLFNCCLYSPAPNTLLSNKKLENLCSLHCQRPKNIQKEEWNKTVANNT